MKKDEAGLLTIVIVFVSFVYMATASVLVYLTFSEYWLRLAYLEPSSSISCVLRLLVGSSTLPTRDYLIKVGNGTISYEVSRPGVIGLTGGYNYGPILFNFKIFSIFVAVLYFAVAYGLLRRNVLAWALSLTLSTTGILSDFYWLIGLYSRIPLPSTAIPSCIYRIIPYDLMGFILNVFIIIYLMKPNVRDFFGKPIARFVEKFRKG